MVCYFNYFLTYSLIPFGALLDELNDVNKKARHEISLMSGKNQKNVLQLVVTSYIPEVSDIYFPVKNKVQHDTSAIYLALVIFGSCFLINPRHFTTIRELSNKFLVIFRPLLKLF